MWSLPSIYYSFRIPVEPLGRLSVPVTSLSSERPVPSLPPVSQITVDSRLFRLSGENTQLEIGVS